MPIYIFHYWFAKSQIYINPCLHKQEFDMSQFFKKPNGIVIQVNQYHDVASLKARFEECDINGNPIKVEKKATKKSSKKTGGKYWLLLQIHFYIMMIRL